MCGVVCIWCYAHVGYGVLCTDDAIYVLDVKCYVQVVLRACGTLVLCTYGVVCMIVQVVSCACGVVYILYKWHCVHVVLGTYRACGIVCMWCRVHCVHVVLCTCGIVYALYSGVVYMWH